MSEGSLAYQHSGQIVAQLSINDLTERKTNLRRLQVELLDGELTKFFEVARTKVWVFSRAFVPGSKKEDLIRALDFGAKKP